MGYKAEALLTAAEVAEVTGYTRGHISALLEPGNAHYDGRLRRLRIATDETWRKAFESRAKYVYPRREVAAWAYARHNRLRLPA